MRTKELSEMANRRIWDKKTQTLLSQLEEGCEFLESQKDSLCSMWNRFNGDLFTFYETEKTKVIKEVCTRSSHPCNVSFHSSQAKVKLDRRHQECGIDQAIYSKWCRDHQLSFSCPTRNDFLSRQITQTW
jgi:hypothetical protein